MKNLLRRLFYRLTPKGRILVRRMIYWPLDVWDQITRKRQSMVPPRGMIYTGSGDFIAQGVQFREYFQEYAGLHPGSKVLDIGSGIGRMAVPLTDILEAEKGGFYEGFDVVRSGVDWCNENIHSRFPHFSFRYVPLKNDLYRADGETAEDFRFPYPDQHFDLVILTSVFTHMLPDEVDHYFREIYRVLSPGGKVFATFFVWDNDETTIYSSNFAFPHDRGNYRLMDEKVKSANVAFNKDWLYKSINETGLRIEHELYGNWCDRPGNLPVDFQDILILSR